MSAGFVVDASVGFAWVYHGQATPETAKLLDEIESGVTVLVPSFWFLEVANVLLVAQRRNKITVAERKSAAEKLGTMEFKVDDEATRNAFDQISELAEQNGLTVYDAAYLEIALRRKLSLASRDEALRNAGKRCGLQLV
ncbi:MAG: type II toxin-antitoxin system VapC family toxin [Verrucomicrobiota bacterium]